MSSQTTIDQLKISITVGVASSVIIAIIYGVFVLSSTVAARDTTLKIEMADNKDKVSKLEQKIQQIEAEQNSNGKKTTKIESDVDTIKRDISEIKEILKEERKK